MCGFANFLCTTADPSTSEVFRTDCSNCTTRLIQRKIIVKSEIYTNFKGSWDESERKLPQGKKRQQNLEYEFKKLGVKASKTGEESLEKIKEGFPY